MKRAVVTVAIVLILLATARLVLQFQHQVEGEKMAYVRNLHYNFSAAVDSITMVGNKGKGFLICRLTTGEVYAEVEDRLNDRLKHYEWMRFLFFNSNGKPQIFLRNISNYNDGDSIYVDSDTNKLELYRADKLIMSSTVSDATWHKVSWAWK